MASVQAACEKPPNFPTSEANENECDDSKLKGPMSRFDETVIFRFEQRLFRQYEHSYLFRQPSH
jgi:hypothetical protein